MMLALRYFGLVAGGLIGWQLGGLLGASLGAPDLLLTLVLTSVGAALGLLLAPRLTIEPVQRLRHQLDSRETIDLLAAGLGLLAGLLIAVLMALPLGFLPPPFNQFLPIIAAAICGYLGIAVAVARKYDIIAVFRNDQKALSVPKVRQLVLDTSAIIDGRIADVSQTGFLEGEFLVPRFVLEELQGIADHGDVLRRNRGRRGLEILNRMQKESPVPVRVVDVSLPAATAVDAGLVRLAQERGGTIVTSDYNLNRVAELQGVPVLNLNELANAIRVTVLPGEELVVQVVQEGKEANQGVAYLDDGTMIVIDQGRRAVGSERRVVVTRVLQTAAGRMVFANLRENDMVANSRTGRETGR